MTQPINTPYSSVAAMLGALPGWVPATEQQRVASYNAYDEIYWNNGDTFKILMRGGDAEEDVIYVPTARTIVETINRYVGVGFRFSVLETSGSPNSRATATEAFTNLFAREEFYSKYNSNKRFGLIRADWLWHIMADPEKAEGTRISILAVHPGNYFPVFESDVVEGGDPDKIVKVHLAEEVMNGEDAVVRRQTYEKRSENGTTTIWSSLALFKPDEWTDPDKAAVEEITAEFALPDTITSIPVYHIRNFDEPGNPYGSSELRGFERLLAAINQGFTDEDITLALEGLGVYATDSAMKPVDSQTGEQTDWSIYPGRVLHNAPGFKRVEGVKTVVPYGDHLARMKNELKEASGANDTAIGRVDVQVAESGVALLLHLAPMLAKAAEKDQIIIDKHNQMFFDLRFWFLEYEGIDLQDVTIVAVLGDKLPKNHRQTVDMISVLMGTIPPVLSAQTARELLAREGLNWFAEDEAARVQAEQAQVALAADPAGARAGAEGGLEDDGGALDGTGTPGA